MKPTPKKPKIIIAQVEASGTTSLIQDRRRTVTGNVVELERVHAAQNEAIGDGCHVSAGELNSTAKSHP